MVARTIHDLGESLSDMYAAMRVGYLITDHIESTGQWPTSWENLRPTYEQNSTSTTEEGRTYYAEIQQRVGVKWNATLEELATADSPSMQPFPVVWCFSGKPAGPTAGHEANAVIYRYLTDHNTETHDKHLPSSATPDQQ